MTERYRSAKRAEKGCILDELCATTGWHHKHAVRALRQHETVTSYEVGSPRGRRGRYDATTKDALTALWEASDRVCGKRLKVMIPTLLPALERHGRSKLGKADRDRVLAISAATIDRLLGDVKVAASAGKRRRAGFYSAIRREVPIRTFNDWKSPPPGFCEVDMVAHGGTSVAGSFIQTPTMVDVATDGIGLVFQPAHSPELQPAEHLWPFVDEPLANRCFATIASLDQAVGDRCVAFAQQQDMIRNSTLFHWWPRQRARN